MTDYYNPASWRGGYIPFRIPMFVDTTPPDPLVDTPLVKLCINEDWIPYVQGALKALAREESYQGERSCVQAWVQGGMEIATGIWDACEAVLPEWKWAAAGGSFVLWADAYGVAEGALSPNGLTVLTDGITLGGVDYSNPLLWAGGPVDHIDYHAVDPLGSYYIQWLDCADEYHTYTGVGSFHLEDSEESPTNAKSIVFSGDIGTLTIVWQGNKLCEPA